MILNLLDVDMIPSPGRIIQLAFSSCGPWLLIGYQPQQREDLRYCMIRSMETGALLYTLPAISLGTGLMLPPILCHYQRHGHLLSLISRDGMLKVFTIPQGKELCNLNLFIEADDVITYFSAHPSATSTAPITPGAGMRDSLVAISRSGCIFEIDLNTFSHTSSFLNPGPYDAFCFLPNSQILAACTYAALGNQKNQINFFDFGQAEPIFLSAFDSGIPSISQMTASSRKIAIFGKDRTIRVFDWERGQENGFVTMRLAHKIQDVVDRCHWSQIGLSHDGEIVWAIPHVVNKHQIYLWDVNTADIIRVLEVPRQDLIAAAWNPRKSEFVSCNGLGTLFRWTPAYPERWTAMIPDVQELEENVIYVEREDEFDLNIEEELHQAKEKQKKEQLDREEKSIDVISNGPAVASFIFFPK